MKKIFNWTFGSIFRTFGRIIAYLLIGVLFGFILSKFNIKIVHLLPIMRVNASSITTSSNQYMVQTCSGPGVCDYSIGGSTYNTGYINMNSQFQNNHGPNESKQFVTSIRLRQQFNSSNYLKPNVTYTIRYKFNFDSKLYGYRKPSTWSYVLGVINSNNASTDIPTSNYNVSVTNISNDTYAFYVTLTYTPTDTLRQISLHIKFPYSNTYDFGQGVTTLWQQQMYALNYKTLSITSNQDTSTSDAINNQTIIIENQTNMINDNINELQDALLQDNINDSEVEDALQFDNITENSLGPFATFLTLPLTWVQNILASGQTCSDINLPLPYMSNKYLTLPCMSGFWSKMGALGVLIQACWLAVVGVRIFNGLFLLTVDTISSKDNEDELTKIKSWEL